MANKMAGYGKGAKKATGAKSKAAKSTRATKRSGGYGKK